MNERRRRRIKKKRKKTHSIRTLWRIHRLFGGAWDTNQFDWWSTKPFMLLHRTGSFNQNPIIERSREKEEEKWKRTHGEGEAAAGIDSGWSRRRRETLRPAKENRRVILLYLLRSQRHPSRPCRTRARRLYLQGPPPPHSMILNSPLHPPPSISLMFDLIPMKTLSKIDWRSVHLRANHSMKKEEEANFSKLITGFRFLVSGSIGETGIGSDRKPSGWNWLRRNLWWSPTRAGLHRHVDLVYVDCRRRCTYNTIF